MCAMSLTGWCGESSSDSIPSASSFLVLTPEARLALTAAAGIITAVTGLIVALNQAGILGEENGVPPRFVEPLRKWPRLRFLTSLVGDRLISRLLCTILSRTVIRSLGQFPLVSGASREKGARYLCDNWSAKSSFCHRNDRPKWQPTKITSSDPDYVELIIYR